MRRLPNRSGLFCKRDLPKVEPFSEIISSNLVGRGKKKRPSKFFLPSLQILKGNLFSKTHVKIARSHMLKLLGLAVYGALHDLENRRNIFHATNKSQNKIDTKGSRPTQRVCARAYVCLCVCVCVCVCVCA